MAFYYGSIFSILPLGMAYGVAALIFWFIWGASRGSNLHVPIRIVAALVLLVLPVSEELWIAWNFARACDSAGTFINKKVEVDGFYDETAHSAFDLTNRSLYRYVEQRAKDGRGVERVERADQESAAKALEWFSTKNPGKPFPPSVIYEINNNTEIAVIPKTNQAWLVTRLDRPTARYQFKNADPISGTRWSHKVGRSGTVIVDGQTNEEIARYTSFGREPPWFYVGLGAAPYACDAPGRWPLASGNSLIYREVLIPEPKR